MDLPQPPRANNLNGEAGGGQLIGPPTRLQEHELDVLAPGTLEDGMEHGLGAAEPLSPREGYENAHAMWTLVMSDAVLGSQDNPSTIAITARQQDSARLACGAR